MQWESPEAAPSWEAIEERQAGEHVWVASRLGGHLGCPVDDRLVAYFELFLLEDKVCRRSE